MTGVGVRLGGAFVMAAVLAGAWAVTRTSPEPSGDAAEQSPRPSTTEPAPQLEGPVLSFGGAGLSFAEVGAQVGLNDPAPERTPGNLGAFVGGAAVGDYDGDGVADVMLTSVGAANRLYRGNPEGTYSDVSEAAGLVATASVDAADGSAAAVWADVDGDGDLDLFLGGVGAQGDRLYVNQGDGTFAEEAERRGIEDHGVTTETVTGDPAPFPGYATLGAALADWDRDGDLDLVTTHWAPPRWSEAVGYSSGPKPNQCDHEWRPATEPTAKGYEAHSTRSRFFENDGTGNFTDVTAELGLDLWEVSAFTPVFADYDGDGWPDLFVTGDFCTSRLYRNDQQGGFVDVTEQAGLGSDENAMGSVVEDVDGDGVLDWFVTSIAPGEDGVGCADDQISVGCSGNRLFLGSDDGTFVDATDAYGVRDAAWGWGAAAEDLDNDGRRDLLAVNGYADGALGDEVGEGSGPVSAAALKFHARGAPRLWRGSPGGPWVDGAAEVGLEGLGRSKAVVAFDHNGDGALDLLVANTGAAPQLFQATADPDNHWLQLRLSDPTTPNTRAVGAAVRVLDADDQQLWMGEVRTGSGYQSSGPGVLHVGLGADARAATIEVRWPDGDDVERFEVDSVDTVLDLTRST